MCTHNFGVSRRTCVHLLVAPRATTARLYGEVFVIGDVRQRDRAYDRAQTQTVAVLFNCRCQHASWLHSHTHTHAQRVMHSIINRMRKSCSVWSSGCVGLYWIYGFIVRAKPALAHSVVRRRRRRLRFTTSASVADCMLQHVRGAYVHPGVAQLCHCEFI